MGRMTDNPLRILAAAPSPRHDPAATPALPCAWCEYDLRGLPADANCPECGRPAADTHREAALAPDRATLVGYRQACLALAGAAAVAALARVGGEPWAFTSVGGPVLAYAWIALAYVLPTLACAGAVRKLTRTPAPAVPFGRIESRPPWRIALRAAALIPAVVVLSLLIFQDQWNSRWEWPVSLAATGASAFATWGVFTQLSVVGRRSAGAGLARRAGVLALALPLVTAITFFHIRDIIPDGDGFERVFGPMVGTGYAEAPSWALGLLGRDRSTAGMVALAFAAVNLVLSAWAAAVLVRFSRRFARAAKAAAPAAQGRRSGTAESSGTVELRAAA